MRKVLFSLFGVGMLALCSSQTALAHGWNKHGYHGHARPVYRGSYNGSYNSYWRGNPSPYYGGGYGSCAPGYAGYAQVPYGYGYGYGYAAPGFGVATRNFSLFVQP